MCLPLWCSKSYSQEAESYVVLNTTDGTLTFKHDTEKPSDAYSLNYGYNFPGWKNQAEKIKTVIFDDSFADARPEFCSYWFANCENLTSIIGIENLNTENVKLMMCMFYHCKSLTSLDVSKFDTKNVEDMNGMFDTCSGLTTLDVSNFNTSNVTDMTWMFYSCSTLESLDLSRFNTEKVTTMNRMFAFNENITTIYVSDKFVTTALTNDEDIFINCSKLKGAIEYEYGKGGKEFANYTTGYFTKSTFSGIKSHDANDFHKTNYYDLQGHRLGKLKRGLNIIKRGNKTVKVSVK